MNYLKNTILKFNNQEISNIEKIDPKKTGVLKIPLYEILKIKKIHDFVQTINDDIFSWMQVKNNVCLEKIAFDIYDNENFWDILLIVNLRSPLFQMPYDYDILSDSADSDIEEYEKKVFKKNLPSKNKEMFRKSLLEKLTKENEQFRAIKYIKPNRIYDFLQALYEEKLIERDSD